MGFQADKQLPLYGTRRKKTKNSKVRHRICCDFIRARLAHIFRHARHETGILRSDLVWHLFRLVDMDDDGNALLSASHLEELVALAQ